MRAVLKRTGGLPALALLLCIALLCPGAGGEEKGAVRIGVFPFENDSGRSGDIGAVTAKLIRTELLGKAQFAPKLLQYRPGQTDPAEVDFDKAVELGKAAGVDYVITGIILEAETTRRSSGLGGIYVDGHYVRTSTRRVTSSISMMGELFSVKKGARLDSYKVTGKKTAVALDADIWTDWGNFSTDGAIDESSPAVKALRAAIAQLLDKVTAKIAAEEKR